MSARCALFIADSVLSVLIKLMVAILVTKMINRVIWEDDGDGDNNDCDDDDDAIDDDDNEKEKDNDRPISGRQCYFRFIDLPNLVL